MAVNTLTPDQLAQLVAQSRITLLDDPLAWVGSEEPFYIADIGQVYRQHQRWVQNLPGVRPFYAVKCNPDPTLLRVLAGLGTGFDCASIDELHAVLSLGVDPSRIVYANPCKASSALRFANHVGVVKTTFDNLDELDSIKAFLPHAQLFLRIHANDDAALLQLGEKFGAPSEATPLLLKRAWELGLEVVGVSFHVGSGSSNRVAFLEAMQQAKVVFDQAMQTGYHMKFLDIGGGFQDSSFEMLASAIREAMQLYFHSGITVIAEPGRLYARSVYTLFCKVISRRRQIGKETQPDMLYQNDGVYGSFMNVLIEKETMSPVLLKSNFDLARGGGEHWYSIWGPTCDSVDCVVRRTRVDSEIQVGDWLMYRSMGAYTMATSTRFNGFRNDHEIVYINSEGGSCRGWVGIE